MRNEVPLSPLQIQGELIEVVFFLLHTVGWRGVSHMKSLRIPKDPVLTGFK